jgi:hypothetical protein
MNYFLFIILFLFPCIHLTAQPAEGKFMLGSSITYTNQLNDNYTAQGYLNGEQLTNKNLNVSLQGGYFFTDHLVFGLAVNYVDNNEVQQNLPVEQYTSVSKTWYYGLFGRSYSKITEKLYFINSLAISIQSGTNNAVDDSIKAGSQTPSSLKVMGYEINYAPGFSYFIKDWIAVNASVGGVSYNHYTATTTSGSFTGTSTSNGLLSINLPFSSFNFGVNFFFGKRVKE